MVAPFFNKNNILPKAYVAAMQHDPNVEQITAFADLSVIADKQAMMLNYVIENHKVNGESLYLDDAMAVVMEMQEANSAVYKPETDPMTLVDLSAGEAVLRQYLHNIGADYEEVDAQAGILNQSPPSQMTGLAQGIIWGVPSFSPSFATANPALAAALSDDGLADADISQIQAYLDSEGIIGIMDVMERAETVSVDELMPLNQMSFIQGQPFDEQSAINQPDMSKMVKHADTSSPADESIAPKDAKDTAQMASPSTSWASTIATERESQPARGDEGISGGM